MSPHVTRYASIDYLRVLLAAGVVFAHSVLMTGYDFRWKAEIGYGVLRLVVPAFALLSGFGLYHTAVRGRLSAWLRGLVVLYGIWAAIYLPVWGRQMPDAAAVLAELLKGPMHLWYIVALTQIVAILWVVRRLVPAAWEIPALVGVAVVGAMAATLTQYNFHYGFLGPELMVRRAGPLYLLPFVVQGYVLADWLARRGRAGLPGARVLWAMVPLLLVLRMIEVRWVTGAGAIPMKDPPEFPVLLYLAPLVIVLATLRISLPATRVNLTCASVLIYLMHMGIIIAFVTVGITHVWLIFATSLLLPFLATSVLPHLPSIGRLGGKWASSPPAPSG
ncbi:acyltransferase family protein [Paracoccus sp. T5]